MHASSSNLAALLLAGLAVCSAGGAAAPRGPAPGTEPIDIAGRGMQIDYVGNRLRLSDVTITQGALVIAAREAVADGVELSFEDSRWQFRGDVRIRFADGSLSADLATVSFRANRIEKAAATGSPAKFEQKLESMAQPARGTAGRIDYEVAAGLIRLADKAWLSDGRNEINSDALVYNVRRQRVETEASPGGDDRVRITIKPGEPGPQPAP
jgi:lipopolysaccharide transport protein LptA